MTNTPPVTALAETAALYAVLNEDEVYARGIVASMLPSERATFAGQLDTLRSMLTDEFGNGLPDWPADVERPIEAAGDACQVHAYRPGIFDTDRAGACMDCPHPAGADCHPRT